MKRATAIGHLVEMATEPSGMLHLRDTDIGWPLEERRLDHLAIVEPTPRELADRLRNELPVARRHLRETLDRYWDNDWRRDHEGFGVHPRTTSGERHRPSAT